MWSLNHMCFLVSGDTPVTVKVFAQNSLGIAEMRNILPGFSSWPSFDELGSQKSVLCTGPQTMWISLPCCTAWVNPKLWDVRPVILSLAYLLEYSDILSVVHKTSGKTDLHEVNKVALYADIEGVMTHNGFFFLLYMTQRSCRRLSLWDHFSLCKAAVL